MAIQLPNPGLGDGQTGDNEFVMWTKVKDNFSNTTHAANRLVGTTNGTVPLVENVQKAAFSYIPLVRFKGQAPLPNDLLAGDMVYYALAVDGLKPDNFGGDFWTLRTFALESGTICQEAYNLSGVGINFRVRNTEGSNQNWSEWKPISSNSFTYRITTATAANVTVDSTGVLRRASSSLKYKDVIAKLELDSDLYDKAMQVKPIVYRSKSEADPKDWHFMSFIAEELGELDPALTQWKTHEFNEKGEQVELEKKEAEGINLNAICAVLHATNIYQDKKLKELEQRLTALESNNESKQ